MPKRIIFWGGTGHAKVLFEFVDKIGYTLIAIFDNNPQASSPFPNVPIYYGTEGFENWYKEQDNRELCSLVAIGGSKGRERLEIQEFLIANHIEPIIAIHPTAFVAANVRIGKGSQILANATICTDVEIGDGCIINTLASVDHETTLGNGVHVAPNATLTGCVSVGDYSMIGAAAVVLPRIKIGSNVIVGAGSVVVKDVPDNKIVYGNPANIQREI